MKLFNYKLNRILNRKFITKNSSKKPPYFLLTVPIVTFGLGVWQIKRRQWKLNLIEEINNKVASEPLIIDVDHKFDHITEYTKVNIRGKYLHDFEVFVGPRSLITDNMNLPKSTSVRPNSGYIVITPFVIQNSNKIVLVNRGWIPQSKLDRESRHKTLVNRVIDITGVVRCPEVSQYGFTTKIDNKYPSTNVKSLENISKLYPINLNNENASNDTINMSLGNLENVFIDLDYDAAQDKMGGPIAGQYRINLRNQHFSYIITWFSLSAVTSIVWILKYVI